MKDAILLSMKPKWGQLILELKKTVEMRKFAVKPGTLVYMYITKDKKENLCWKFDYEYDNCGRKLNGKVAASFVVDKCVDMMRWTYQFKDNEFYDILKKACLSIKDLENYTGPQPKKLFAWFIKELKIFDRPKELYDFMRKRKYKYGLCFSRIKKAPQSYCYVEDLV